MVADVLSGSGFSKFSAADLAASLIEVQQSRFEQRAATLSGPYDTRISRAERSQVQWKALSDDLFETRGALHDALGRAKTIKSKLEGMRLAVSQADLADAEQIGYGASFQGLLQSLRSEVTRTDQSPNLLGSDNASLEFETDLSLSRQSISGFYVGAGYTIEDSDGQFWHVDETHGLLRRYVDYPEEADEQVANLVTGIELDSLSDDAISFTVGPDTAAPESFSGTLERDGLGVLDAWAYDSLLTEAGRASAVEDIESAMLLIETEVRRYEVGISLVEFYGERADQEADGARGEINDAILERARVVGEAQETFSREMDLLLNNVSQSFTRQSFYAQLFQPRSPFDDQPASVFDILA